MTNVGLVDSNHPLISPTASRLRTMVLEPSIADTSSFIVQPCGTSVFVLSVAPGIERSPVARKAPKLQTNAKALNAAIAIFVDFGQFTPAAGLVAMAVMPSTSEGRNQKNAYIPRPRVKPSIAPVLPPVSARVKTPSVRPAHHTVQRR